MKISKQMDKLMVEFGLIEKSPVGCKRQIRMSVSDVDKVLTYMEDIQRIYKENN